MKKQLVLLILVVMLTFSTSIHAQWVNGDGSQGDPYQISDTAMLAYLSQQVNLGNDFNGTYFVLTNNLNLAAWDDGSGEGWVPIGTNLTPFSGNFSGYFNGERHVIDSLTINRNADRQGLFGYIGGGGVDNLGLTHVAISGGTSEIGGLAGSVNNSTYTHCYVSGTINSGSFVGGLFGTASNCTISSCYSSGSNSGSLFVGGLIGELINGTNLSDSYSSSNVSGVNVVGGLVGLIDNSVVTNCYSKGSVNGSDNVGGLAGDIVSGTLSNSVAVNPSITFAGTSVGRISGAAVGLSSNYAWSGILVNGNPITGGSTSDINGEDKSLATLYNSNFYINGSWGTSWNNMSNQNNGSFVWNIWDEQSLPYFQWQSAPANVVQLTPVQVLFNIRNGVDSVVVDDITTSTHVTTFSSIGQGSYYFDSSTLQGDELMFTVYETNQWTSYPVITNSNNPAQFCGGDGTSSNPYQVCDTTSLANIARLVNTGAAPNNFNGIYFRLASDLNLADWDNGSGQGWVPIGYNGNGNNRPFSGWLHGGGYTIDGLTITRTADQQGLFGYLSGANIDSLYLTNIRLDINGSGNTNIGGIAGITEYSNIYNSRVSGNITGKTFFVGGVLGIANVSTNINNSSSSVNITAEAAFAGSLAGFINGNSNLFNCYATGDIIHPLDSLAGGLVGILLDHSTLVNCYSSGKVSGSHYLGGIAGAIANGATARDSYSSSDVSGLFKLGGFVGAIDSCDIYRCYSSGNVSGQSFVGGVIGFNHDEADISNIHDCMSINPTINCADANVGIIIPSTAVLSNNLAWNGVKVNGNPLPAGSGTASGPNGEDTSLDSLQAFSFSFYNINPPTDSWWSNGWTNWEKNSYPYFWQQSAPVNAYLLTPSRISYSLHNDADSVVLNNLSTGSKITTFNSPIQGSYMYDNSPQLGDTLSFTVYENGRWLSYPFIVNTNSTPQFCNGDGSQANPYQICDTTSLANLARVVNSGSNFNGIYFRLTADLNLADWDNGSGEGWIPIGTSSNPFSGFFNGGGHTIAGMRINRTGDMQGLFGRVSNGSIDSLGVTTVSIQVASTGNGFIGALVGTGENSSITACHSSGSISGASTGIGGLVGGLQQGSLANSHSSVNLNLTSPSQYAGGLAGFLLFNSNVSDCYSTGSVINPTDSLSGGLVGLAVFFCNINRSYSSGNVKGDHFIGGFIGGLAFGSVATDCYSTGSVSGDHYIGGFAGAIDSASVIRCYSIGNVSGRTSSGGLIGFNHGEQNYSAVTNNMVASPTISTTDALAARISLSPFALLANNYAWEGTTVNGATVSGTSSNGNGQSKSMADLQSAAFYSTAGNWGTPWSIDQNPALTTWSIWNTHSFPYFQQQSAPIYGLSAIPINLMFNLRNAADSVVVYKLQSNQLLQLKSYTAVAAGAFTRVPDFTLSGNDTLAVMVYEHNKWPSYPIGVTVVGCANITTQPIGGVIGVVTQLTVVASDATGYQWYKDGQAIAGQTTASCAVSGLGQYYVAVSGVCGVVNSNTVSVIPPIVVKAGNTSLMPASDGTYHFIGECGQRTLNLDVLTADPSAIVRINGIAGNSNTYNIARYGDNIVTIEVDNPVGGTKIYKLIVSKLLDTQTAFVWGDVPTINCNPSTNGGYTFVSFQWYKDGLLISGATKPYYQTKQPGAYSCEVTTDKGEKLQTCPLQATTTVQANIVVYPNPVQSGGTLRLLQVEDFLKHGKTEVQLYDISGRLHSKQLVSTKGQSIVAPTQAGVYLLRFVNTAGEVQTSKIMVQ